MKILYHDEFFLNIAHALIGKFYNALITTTYGIKSDAAGSTKLRSSPLDFAYTGYYSYSSGSLSYETTDGNFWSRTASSSAYTYYLNFSSSEVKLQSADGRGTGNPLRCAAK